MRGAAGTQRAAPDEVKLGLTEGPTMIAASAVFACSSERGVS